MKFSSKVGSFLSVLCIAATTVIIVPFCHAGSDPPPTAKPTNPPRAVKNDNQQPDRPIRPVKPKTPPPTKQPVVVVTAPPTLKPTNPPRPAKARGPTKFPTNSPICFSLSNLVEIEGQGVVSMKEVKVGDKVRDAKGNMVTVYSLGHYKVDNKAQYNMLQIHADGLSQPLEVSTSHFIFVNGKPIAASDVTIGMKLDLGQGIDGIIHGVSATVQKIKPIMTSSFISPKTTSGTITVNGVAASCYASAQPNGSHLALLGGGLYQMPFSKHWLWHMIQTPHRLMCSVRMDACKAETFTKDGFSIHMHLYVRMLAWFHKPGWGLLTIVALMMVLVLMQILCFVEFIVLSSNPCLAMVVALVGSAVVVGSWLAKVFAVKQTKVKNA